MAVVHFSKEGFEKARAQGGVMLVDFWATWCGPCKMIAPVIEQLAQEFGVMSIPNVVILKDGQLADRKVGAMPVSAYQQALDAALN